MVAPAVVIAFKAAVAAATDKRTWKGIAILITAVLMPFILTVLLLMSFLSGGASHNSDAVSLVFHGGDIPSNTPVDYQQHITDMRSAFSKLDAALSQITPAPEDGGPDPVQVRAIFYALFFGADSLQEVDYNAFVHCFVETKTVTRTVQNADGGYIQKSSTVTVTLTSLPQVYANPEKSLREAITSDDEANDTQIYSLIKYGTPAPEETDSASMWDGWSPPAYSGSYTTTQPGDIGLRAVQLANSRLGDPYSETLRGTGDYTDCSYLVLWAYRQLGVQLPGTAAEQGQYCVEHGLTVSKAGLAPGDLVFWSYEPNGRFMDITHVAIYAGNGMVVSASSTKEEVVYSKIFDGDKQVLYGRPY